MSDHYHYDYAGTHHDHHGDYAGAGHDHGNDYAEKYHRHYDDESTARGLREDLGHAEARISDLEGELDSVTARIAAAEQKHAEDIRRLWDALSQIPTGGPAS
jgi:hypothetical protein